MDRQIAIPIMLAIVVGLGGLNKFAAGVPTVSVVGLFASGAAVGAGLARVILALRGKVRE